VLAFDNMNARPLKGTFGWQPASVVLDVAPDARVIAFGVLQDGDGTTYTGGVTLDVVGNDVASSDVRSASAMPKQPVNLSLSK
jgi:hypothetical protein